MTLRQDFIETLTFGTPERIPLMPGKGRISTKAAWNKQGLPGGVTDTEEFAYREAGGKLEWPPPEPPFAVNERMIPQFEEKVLEERERSKIVQDWKGNICEIGKEYTVDYLRNAVDFVTRRWIKCPVESREDWEEMKKRYDPEDPSRFPPNPESLSKRLETRKTPLILNFSGPFWQMREWLGFERLCMWFHDEPELIREMVRFWEEYLVVLLIRTFQYLVPDMIIISEDMAYKSFPMISPAMTREFLFPTYRRWGEIIRGSGCPLYAIDSDGYIGDLIPVWLDAGVNVCLPMEVAAGNDLHELRSRFGKNLAFKGGVDKRAIARGGSIIEDHLNRLEPIIEDGGFIPSCDHGVPADVSWPDFVRYVGLLAGKLGWL